MKPFFMLFCIGAFITIASCYKKPHRAGGDDICETTGPIVVYKTKKDYSNNVSVQLSADKKTVTAYPGSFEVHKPIPLANGYYLQTTLGNAFLSITLDQYADTNNNYPHDQLIEYVIDPDPFTEFYEVCPCAMVAGRDTFSLNRLILHDSLSKCNRH